ncbi:MAG: ACP S-malonyltransferase, partial [Alphaproteobacteria bacterium]|nr:ACP S-malonyltransferase [Alphaproteobacteria bacterium]
MARAFVFPGQGSQVVGMGKALADALPTAREVFEEVDEALSQKLSQLMFEGPIEDLTLTENAQPALMAMSVAVMRVLRKDGGLEFGKHVQFVAGHSLGEYSALCAADALPLDVTARLLKKRGQAMQKAVPVGVGTMAALLGLDFEAAQGVARDAAKNEAGDQVCDLANDNAPGQVVVSGHVEAVERAVELAKDRGARRPMILPVSAPFHCALMQPAAEVMAEALATAPLVAPAVPLIANVSADATSDPDEIRKMLVTQVTSMVRWRESVLYMRAQDVDKLVEVGAGKVLTTMLKRIDKEISGQALNEPDQI